MILVKIIVFVILKNKKIYKFVLIKINIDYK